MTHVHQRYLYATTFAVVVALLLRVLQVPAPWPAAISIYVYGVVAWPKFREKLPNLQPSTYAAGWLGAAMMVFVLEHLGSYGGW